MLFTIHLIFKDKIMMSRIGGVGLTNQETSFSATN